MAVDVPDGIGTPTPTDPKASADSRDEPSDRTFGAELCIAPDGADARGPTSALRVGGVNFGSAVTGLDVGASGAGAIGDRFPAAGIKAPKPRPSRDMGACFF